MMGIIAGYIIEDLGRDLVYHGWLVQCIRLNKIDCDEQSSDWKNVVRQLLLFGRVEVGMAIRSATRENYLEFMGWKGTVEERVSRAVRAVDCESDMNKPFAYWLCLRENVDRFEGDAPLQPTEGN